MLAPLARDKRHEQLRAAVKNLLDSMEHVGTLETYHRGTTDCLYRIYSADLDAVHDALGDE